MHADDIGNEKSCDLEMDKPTNSISFLKNQVIMK